MKVRRKIQLFHVIIDKIKVKGMSEQFLSLQRIGSLHT